MFDKFFPLRNNTLFYVISILHFKHLLLTCETSWHVFSILYLVVPDFLNGLSSDVSATL